MAWRRHFTFPNPVNEVAARVVATGVVLQAVLFLVVREWWLLVPLAYGFAARVLAGPRFSPLGLIATRVVVPRLPVAERLVAGPPKRFAQGIGLAFSASALVTQLAGATTAANVLIALLLVAASLEAFAGLCLGCVVFNRLMAWGVVPTTVCEACADIRPRLLAAQQRT